MELYDLRALIEGHLIELAVPNVTAEVLGEARAIEEAMRACEDHDEWLALSARLHDRIYACSGSPVVLEVAAQQRARADHCLRRWARSVGHRDREVARGHRHILACVARGDARRARVELERQIRRLRDRALMDDRMTPSRKELP